ncbi:MAG: DNA polymerase IV [Kiritimatiellae bacterium]|nr:DNA polymerase IV [Kiritimatiellia bacterium]
MSHASPILTGSFPQAIVHVDADAFFASVEEALEPSLRGKPVVTGQERGIVACPNYLAKACGVQRGVPIFKAKKVCPDLVVLPSDYETYSLYSKRMFAIMRRYSPFVEEYSIDEAFLDITGMRSIFRSSYEDIVQRLRAEIADELGMTVSAGLSLSKGLAKLCSKFRKPDGFTAVPGRYIHVLLQRTPVGKVWGIGHNIEALLQKYGVQTAYDFVMRPEAWVRRLLKRPGHDLWRELRGESVHKVTDIEPGPKYTIMKSKTFTPPSREKEFVYARLVRNVESAFMKARRHTLRTASLCVVLRHQDYHHSGLEARLSRPTSSTLEAMPLIRGLFEQVFEPGREYRSTMIVLGGLDEDTTEQYDLFEDRIRIEKLRRITIAQDSLNARYGKHTVSSGTMLALAAKPHMTRDDVPERRTAGAFKGETARQRIRLPRLNIPI